jgi:hypothetical protein
MYLFVFAVLKRLQLVVLFISTGIAIPAFAQWQSSSQVKLTFSKTNKTIKINSKPRFEIVNGKLNISLRSEDNALFQINSIPEKLLKDTSVNIRGIKAIYILPDKSKTYTTSGSKQISITIKTKKIGSKQLLAIQCKDVMQLNDERILFEATCIQSLPKSEFQSTK